LGGDVALPKPWRITGFDLPHGPHVWLSPSLGPTIDTLRPRFLTPSAVHIHDGATVVLDGTDIVVEALDVRGTLVVKAAPGAVVGTSCACSRHDAAALPTGCIVRVPRSLRTPADSVRAHVGVVVVAVAVIRNLTVNNRGWELVPADDGIEEIRMRGFTIVKHEQLVLSFPVPGTYVVDARP
jgi:hypothetical protein